MPTLSKRGATMPASPIRKLAPFAEKAKRAGKKIYHLNIGQPDIHTPKKAMDAVRNFPLDIIAYTHSAGIKSYRKKLVDYYETFNVDIHYDDIIVTTGGSEAILFSMMTGLDSSEEIIIPEPFYANYYGFLTASNLLVKPITSYIEKGFALPPISDFEKAITYKTRAILICNPNNPTGYLYSRKELLALKEIVLKHDLFLFVDEVYREFSYSEEPYCSILSIEGLEDHVVVIDSISKRFSACGARIGAIVSRNKAFIQNAMKFAQARLSPPTIEQVMAEACLEELSYLNDVKAKYNARRKVLIQRLQAMEGVTCPIPSGAFYAFVRLPIDDGDKFCRWLLETFEYNGATVMIAPGSGFYATAGLGKQEVRIAYVLNTAAIHKAMDCLEVALKVYPGRIEC